jgi:nucleotide-binding universal stress UspA family protein
MYKKILVPTDGSELSEEAANAAIQFARACGSELFAFSVARPYPLMTPTEASAVLDTGVETRIMNEAAQRDVEKIASAAKQAGVPCETGTSSSFFPYQAIINAAREHQCDLIFMASHGRRGLSRLLAGSETQNVLAYSAIPVLVLRPRIREALPDGVNATEGPGPA